MTRAAPRPSGAMNLWRKARTLFQVWFAHMTVYRAELVIWMLSGLVPLFMLAVWIAKADAAGGAIGGFDRQEFAAYFLAAWMSQQWTVAWVAWEFSFQVRTGSLSPKLLRPLDPVWEHFMAHITEHFVRFPFVLALILAGLLVVPGTVLAPGIGAILAYAVCVNLAFGIRFLIAYCIGLLAFWFEEASAFDEFYWLLALFLAGGFAPLEFYPAAVRAVVELTPFPYIIYYPSRVLTGALSAPEVTRVLLVQLAWIAVFLALRAWLWRRGLRRYGAVGA